MSNDIDVVDAAVVGDCSDYREMFFSAVENMNKAIEQMNELELTVYRLKADRVMLLAILVPCVVSLVIVTLR